MYSPRHPLFILARSANQKADLRMQVPCYNEVEGWRKNVRFEKLCPSARLRRRKNMKPHILQMRENW